MCIILIIKVPKHNLNLTSILQSFIFGEGEIIQLFDISQNHHWSEYRMNISPQNKTVFFFLTLLV